MYNDNKVGTYETYKGEIKMSLENTKTVRTKFTTTLDPKVIQRLASMAAETYPKKDLNDVIENLVNEKWGKRNEVETAAGDNK